MPDGPPKLIAIDHDDHAEYVGRTADGRQFFLTTPFESVGDGREGREFVALYLFDPRGQLLDAKIDDLGPRAYMDLAKRESIRDERIRSLGQVSFERIIIAPFKIQRFDTTFGLIPQASDGDNDSWVVELQPGNFMAFVEPWDSGVYDT